MEGSSVCENSVGICEIVVRGIMGLVASIYPLIIEFAGEVQLLGREELD